jgi:hypothetical protein
MRVRSFQIQKKSTEIFDNCQDKIHLDLNEKKFAVADGATQGFKSEVWADAVSKSFVQSNQDDFVTGLKSLAEGFNSLPLDNETGPMAFLEKKKKERGGNTAILGAKVNEEDESIDFLAVGDSCAFMFSNDEIMSWPFKNLDELNRCQTSINSKQILEENYSLDVRVEKIKCAKLDEIWICSDALSRFILKDFSILEKLRSLSNFESFYNFCIDCWENDSMEHDDISFLRIEIKGENEYLRFEPPEGFFFEQPKAPAYSISNQIENEEEIENDEKMREQLEILTCEIRDLKSQLKRNLRLTICVITILSVGFILYETNALKNAWSYIANDIQSDEKDVKSTSQKDK